MSRISILQKHISKSNPTIIEAGIHRGEDTLEFLKVWPNAYIYAFEPDPRNVAIITASGLDKNPRINFQPLALSDDSGLYAEMFLSNMKGEVWSASSSLNFPKEHLKHFPNIDFNARELVMTITLDKAIPPGVAVDIIWLDVQGHELSVLKGAKRVLARTGMIYMEYYNVEMYEGQPKVSELMAELGPEWEIVDIWPSEILVKRKGYN